MSTGADVTKKHHGEKLQQISSAVKKIVVRVCEVWEKEPQHLHGQRGHHLGLSAVETKTTH